jgi:hypothetical protein
MNLALLYFAIALTILSVVDGFHHQQFQIKSILKITTNKIITKSPLYARVARAEEEQVKEASDSKVEDMMTIPYSGLIGRENSALFDKPIDVMDPMKNTDDLPGADGSDEKIAAIQARIQERVAALKAAGEWSDDVDVFGKDPLATQPIWQTMIMQLKVCKPFESFDELALTYVLMLSTTFTLMGFLLVTREVFDGFIDWFVKTDFF